MTEGTLALTDLARTGINPVGTLPTVTDGDKFNNTGKEFLAVVNASLSLATVVTVDAFPTNPQSSPPDGLTVTDRTVSIPAGESRMIGPFPPSIYSDVNGYAHVKCAPVTDVTIKALRLIPNSG
jgi:hypothetical protein